jgi:isopentenyldiphosphate isomerase
MPKTPADILKYIEIQRAAVKNNDTFTQRQLNRIIAEMRPFKQLLLEDEKEEVLDVIGPKGEATPLMAPRWVCHVLGLRHRCIHILLQWKSPALSNVCVLQVRAWNKFDEPAHLDISVSGHAVGGDTIDQTTALELKEELGLSISDVQGSELLWKTAYESANSYPQKNFYNLEWCEVFTAELATSAFEKIAFTDEEVVGIYLCPLSELNNLLKQKQIPLASGLKKSIPYFL